MARLTALPSIDVIHGFRGILDFYLWKGLPCVRSWPRMTKAQQTEGTIAASALFGAISQGYALLGDGPLQAFQEAAKTQPRTARDLYISAVYGHLHERTIPEPPPPPEEEMYDAYVCLRDVKAQNSYSGNFEPGAWRTRDLNHEQADTEDICTLSANQITLPAGTYRCTISCPAFATDRHQARLYNVTDAATLLLGTSEISGRNHYNNTRSLVAGRFTLAATKILEVQHQCETSSIYYGFGMRANFGDEIFAVAEFWREIET